MTLRTQQITPTLITFHQGGQMFMAMIATAFQQSVDRPDFFLRKNREHWFQVNGESLSPWSGSADIAIQYETMSIDEFLDQYGQELSLIAISQAQLQSCDWNNLPSYDTVPSIQCNKNLFVFDPALTGGAKLYVGFLVDSNDVLKSVLWYCDDPTFAGVIIDEDTKLVQEELPEEKFYFFEDVYFPNVCPQG